MLRYMKKYWIFALLAALFMIGEVAADMIQPKLMARIVDDGILGLSGNGTPDIALITTVGIRMLLIVLAGGLFGILCAAMTNICGQSYGNEVRKACFSRIMGMSFEQTDSFTTGSLITRVTNDVSQVQRLVMSVVRGLIRSSMFLIAGTFTLLSLNVHFNIVVACAFPLVILDIVFILWKTNPLFAILQKRIDRMNTVIGENISGARVVRAFIQEDTETGRFDKANTELVETQMRVLILTSFMRPIMNIILNMAVVALIWIGGIQTRAGAIRPGDVMAAITYISQILNGMMMLAMIFQTFSRGFASGRRLNEILRTEPAITDGPGVGETPEKGSVRFRNVTFSYPDNQAEVLHDIDLEVRPGEVLGIIGSTGCGKTSLVSLISRFYDATEGTVEVDGVNVRDYKLKDLRERVAAVPQKNELFSTTIRENILIGREQAGEEEVRAAAQAAQAEEFILEQPHGYDTPVAEGGTSLSGGQRQRVAIARALLKKGEILILDDSTSALDLVTEARLYDALDRDYAGITRIIIAQRIASIKNADRIAVMENGSIIACAGHEELLRTCATYQDIYHSQVKMGGAAE